MKIIKKTIRFYSKIKLYYHGNSNTPVADIAANCVIK